MHASCFPDASSLRLLFRTIHASNAKKEVGTAWYRHLGIGTSAFGYQGPCWRF